MKSPLRLCVALIASVAIVALASAQTTLFSDSLLPPRPGSEVWSSTAPAGASTGNGSSTFESYGLAYQVTSATGSDSGYRTLTSYAAPTTSNWSVRVNAHLGSFAGLSAGQYVNLNLIVVDSANSGTRNASLALDRYATSGGAVVRGVEVYFPASASSAFANTTTNSNEVTLRVDYNSTAKTLTYYYDGDGAANGASFAQLGNASDLTSWGMGPSGTFGLLLVGGSGAQAGNGPLVNPTDAYFTDFTVQSAAAVPEASTSALLAGLAALAVALWRRR
jgi:hypothetical protein